MKRKCIICGEEFETTIRTQKVCPKQHYRPCPICGKMLPFSRPSDRVKFCSKGCSRENTKRKNIEKYGTEHPMQNPEVKQHYKKTMLDKYGVESPLQSEEIKHKAIQSNQERFGADWALANREVREHAKSTMKSRYGVEYTLQSEELFEKVKKTSVERYGVENPQMNEEIKGRSITTCIEKYGVENPMQFEEIKQKAKKTRLQNNSSYMTNEMKQKAQEKWLMHYGVTNPSFSGEVIQRITDTFEQRYGVKRAVHVPEFRDKMIATTMEKYGVPYYVVSEEYQKNNGHIRISSKNKCFARKLQALHISHSLEFPIGMKVYDILLTDKNILIEINPSYTHNVIGNHWNSQGLEVDYHLQKTVLARDNGYRCIHVFDWDNQFDIVGLVADKSPIYARKCELHRITTETVKEFTSMYHLQGSCRGQKISYGLFYNSKLMQVMSFGKPRYNSKYQWELLRLCTIPGYYVIGGSERLFKAFLKEMSPESIISYCDLSKFSGDVYLKLGFKHSHNTAPTKNWSKGCDRITNNLLLQRGYDQLFNANYGKGTDNEKLMIEHGWLPVYDCGQGVYVWKNE